MYKTKLNYRGFSHHFVFVFFILIFAVVGVGYKVATNAASQLEPTNTYFVYSEGGKYKYVYVWGHGRCGTKTVLYTTGTKSNALVFKMPSKASDGTYSPIKLICTANEKDSFLFAFSTTNEAGPNPVSAGEGLESTCLYVHSTGVTRTVPRENGSCQSDFKNNSGSSSDDSSSGSDAGPTATSSGVAQADRAVVMVARHIAGKELGKKLGIGTDEDRSYIFTIQGPGQTVKNRATKGFKTNFTDHPISGVKVKLSSKDRSKTSGCGINGPFFHRNRDSTQVTNGNGGVAFTHCTNGDFSLTLSNIPVEYVLPGQDGRSAELNMNDRRYIQLERVKEGEFDGIMITITLQPRTRLAPFTQAQKTAFAAAASKYWHQVTPTQAQRRVGTIDIDQTTVCKPNQVQYKYVEYKGGTDAFAWAPAGGARPDRPKSQCTVTWNLSESNYEYIKHNPDVIACMAFVHEYGHLLGQVAVKEVKSNGEISYKIGHSSNPDNIMYKTLNPDNGHLIKETGCHKPGAVNKSLH